MSGGGLVQVVDRESFFRASHVSRETMERFAVYESCLVEWQRKINLISAGTLPGIWQRHFWDSAQLAPLVPENARNWVDLGSGAGLPGLVLALIIGAERPFTVHLVESDQRKSIFLREVIRRTGAPAIVHNARMEAPETIAGIGICDGVSARACAPLDRLLGWAAPYFGPTTVGLFLKGVKAEEELTNARKSWKFEVTRYPSEADAEGTVLKVERLSYDR
ncbi:MAG: 16S rRNA (guanine(527)-N(7))-methyltransferase RsmG [Parvibaculum sp.]